MTEAEWRDCECPYDILRYLNGKIVDDAFMRFSVACCRRIWPLITDSRSKAVVEATEAHLAGSMSAEAVGEVYAEWNRASLEDEVNDGAGWYTEEAIETVCGGGYCSAATVAMACFKAAGYAAMEARCMTGAPEPELTAAWEVAELAERRAQCQLLRELFGYRGGKGAGIAGPGSSADHG